MKKPIEKNNHSRLALWLKGPWNLITLVCSVLLLFLTWWGIWVYHVDAKTQNETEKDKTAVEFKVEINELPSSESWVGEKTVWNNRFSRIVSIKNISDQVILSNARQKAGYDIYSWVNVFYESNDWAIQKLLKQYDFTSALEPQKSADIYIDIQLPDYESWEIVVEVQCKETPTRRCRVPHDKKRYQYKKNQASNLKIIFVDATKVDDLVEVGTFRKDIKDSLQVTGGALKAVYSKIPFPLKHKNPKEAWGWAVLLYNPVQWHSATSDVTLEIKQLLLARYWYIGNVVLAEYNSWTVEHYWAYLSECKPFNCISTSLKHEDLNLETNLFSKELYQENPKEDFMIFLPYNN